MAQINFQDKAGEAVSLEVPDLFGNLSEEQQTATASHLIESYNSGERFAVAGWQDPETQAPQFEKVPLLDSEEDTIKMAETLVDFRQWGGEEKWTSSLSQGKIPQGTPASLQPILGRAIAEQKYGVSFQGPLQIEEDRPHPWSEEAQQQADELRPQALKENDPLRQFTNVAADTVSMFGLGTAQPAEYVMRRAGVPLGELVNGIAHGTLFKPETPEGNFHPVWERALRDGTRHKYEVWTGRAAQRISEAAEASDVGGGYLGELSRNLGSSAGILPYAFGAGPFAMIGAATLSAASEAELAANDAGLTAAQKTAHVLTQGGIEGGVTAVFSLLGFGGLEKLAPQFTGRVGKTYLGRLAARSIGKSLTPGHRAAIQMGSELLEENIITQAQLRTSAQQLGLQEVDYWKAHLDTSILTLTMTGPFAGSRYLSDKETARAKDRFRKLLSGVKFTAINEGPVTERIPSRKANLVVFPKDYYQNSRFSETPVGRDLNYFRTKLEAEDQFGVPIVLKHPAIEAWKNRLLRQEQDIATTEQLKQERENLLDFLEQDYALEVLETDAKEQVLQNRLERTEDRTDISRGWKNVFYRSVGLKFEGIERNFSATNEIESDVFNQLQKVNRELQERSTRVKKVDVTESAPGFSSIKIERGPLHGFEDAIVLSDVKVTDAGEAKKLYYSLRTNFPGLPLFIENAPRRSAEALANQGWVRVAESDWVIMADSPKYVMPDYQPSSSDHNVQQLIQDVAEADHLGDLNDINPVAHNRALTAMIVNWAERHVSNPSERFSVIQNLTDQLVKGRELFQEDIEAISRIKNEPFAKLLGRLERLSKPKVGQDLKQEKAKLRDAKVEMERAIRGYVDRAKTRGEVWDADQLVKSLTGYIETLYTNTYSDSGEGDNNLDIYAKASGLDRVSRPKKPSTERAEKTVASVTDEIVTAPFVVKSEKAQVGSLNPRIGIVSQQSTLDDLQRSIQKLTYGIGPKTLRELELVESNLKSSVQTEVDRGLRRFKRAVRKDFGPPSKVTTEVIDRMNRALVGDTASLSQLPEGTRTAISDMRQHIDVLSQQLLDAGVLSEALQLTVSENQGVYIHRKYRAFDPSKVWYKRWEDVPRNIRTKAEEFFVDVLGYNRTDEDAIASIGNQLLNINKSQRAAIPAFAKAGDYYELLTNVLNIKNADLSPLKKKKDIHDGLRALWGEVSDPAERYAQSAMAVVEVLARQNFFSKMNEIGTQEGWVSEKLTRENFLQLDKNVRRYGDLAGKYVPQDVMSFLNQENKVDHSELTRVFTKLNSLAKRGKILAPAQVLRNFLGAGITTIFNGNFSFEAGVWKESAQVLKEGVVGSGEGPQQQSRKSYFDALGVTDTNVQIRFLDELASIAGESTGLLQFVEKATDWADQKLIKQTKADQLYLAMDNFFKVMNWNQERKAYARAFPNATDAWLDQKAADNVQRIMPTYPRAFKIVEKFKSHPILGTFFGAFMTFRLEMIRTSIDSYRLALEEVKSPETRAMGYRRLGMKSVGIINSKVLKWGSLLLTGMKFRDDDDLRKLMPDYYRDANFVYPGVNHENESDPSYTVLDMSYIDPFNDLVSPFVIGARELREGDAGEALLGAGFELIRPFTNAEIFTRGLLEAAMGRDLSRQGESFVNPEEEFGKQTFDRVEHFWNTVEPALVKQATDITFGDPKVELLNLLSVKTIKVSTNYRQKVKEFKWRLGNRRRADLDETGAVEQLKEWTRGARNLGLSDGKIMQILQEEKIPEPYRIGAFS